MTLWRSAVQASPNSFKTHLKLADLGVSETLPEVERAIAIVDGLPDEINTPLPYVAGGRRFREKGDLQKSLALLLRGERIQRGRYERIRRQPEVSSSGEAWLPVYEELAATYLRLGNFPFAVGV